jgi:hypothetical protein
MTLNDLLSLDKIRNVRADYCAYLDAQDIDGLMGLFTDDAVLEFGEGATAGKWIGRDAIRHGYGAHMKMNGAPFDIIHVVTNPWIRITAEDSAYGRWYLMIMVTRLEQTAFQPPGSHGHPLFMLAIYEDRYLRVDGVWKIATLHLHALWPERRFRSLTGPE